MADDERDDAVSDDRCSYLNSTYKNQSATFVVGERCMARWPGDKKFYEARIKKFRKTSLKTFGLVTYSGYDSGDDEWIDVNELKKIIPTQKHTADNSDNVLVIKEQHSNTVKLPEPLFSPLKGDEEQQMLADKYRCLDDDSSTEDESFGVDVQKLGNSVHLSTLNGSKARSSYNNKIRVRSHTVRRQSEKEPAQPTDTFITHSDDFSTFDDEDDDNYEKPFFPKVKAGEKVALLLSEPGAKPEVKVPATINRYLRDYQRDGIRFLYQHYAAGHGVLLADDMGLGKTVQVIAFIAALLGRTGTKSDLMAQKPDFIRKMCASTECRGQTPKCQPFLVIGPACVLHNWFDEFDTWGYFRVSKYHQQHKIQTLADLRRDKVDVVITTYETFRDHVDELNKCKWEAVFADEVHKIKGLKSGITKALRKLTCLRRFGLSGTPLQNNIQELWSLLDWCNPGCLGNLKQFNRKYCSVIEAGQKHNATKRQLAEARRAQAKLAAIRDKWMLRRTKALIKDELPKKSEMVVYCQPTPLQVSVYKAILNLDWIDYVLKQQKPCPCGSKRIRRQCCYKRLPLPPPDDKPVMALTMSYMHLLLKAANHVALLLPSHTTNENQRKEAEKIYKTVFSEHPEFVHQTRKEAFKTLFDPKYSGKMKVLQGLLSVFRKQQAKVLIFSYSTQLLDIIEIYVMSMGYEYHRLDGNTNQTTRAKLISDFNRNPNVFLFLISTRAGGIGLNLTGANVVVIFDPNWNPTHDLQAQDRAYRIGQRREVRVYRLITSGTIEENIYLRQIHKQHLGDVAISSKNAKRLFYKNELHGIESTFQFRPGDKCLTEEILERHSKIEEDLRPKSADYYIEEYVPCDPGKSTHQEHSSLKESDHEDSDEDNTGSEDDDFGLKYICTQLIDFNEEKKDTPKRSVRSEHHSKPNHQELIRERTKSKKNIKHQNEGKCKQTARDNDDSNSMDDFLDQLLTVGSPSKHYSIAGSVSSVKTDMKSVSVSTTRTKTADNEDCMPCGKNDKTSEASSTENDSDDILGDLWNEMESVVGTQDKVKAVERHSGMASRITDINKEQSLSEGTEGLESEDMSDGTLEENFTKIKNRKQSGTKRHVQSKSDLEHKKLKYAYEDNRSSPEKQSDAEFCLEGNDTFESEPSPDISRVKHRDRPRVSRSNQTSTKPPAVAFESITDVFAECGVVHIHQNAKVTASCTVEDHMSRCAMEDVYIKHDNTQALAAFCPRKTKVSCFSKKPSDTGITKHKQKTRRKTQARSKVKREKICKKTDELGMFHGPKSSMKGKTKILIGQTPKAIKRQHFLKLARCIQKRTDPDCDVDVVRFAKHLLCSSRKKHIQWLQEFYKDVFPK